MKFIREALAILAVTLPAIYIAVVWPSVPAIIPNHFGSDGLPYRFAPRGTLWLLFGISLVVFLLLSVVRRLPQTFNLPRPIGDLDRPRLEALGIELLSWMRLEVALMFDCLIWALVRTALHRGSFHGNAFFFMPILIVAVTATFFLVHMKRSST